MNDPRPSYLPHPADNHALLAFEHDFIPFEWTDRHLAVRSRLNCQSGRRGTLVRNLDRGLCLCASRFMGQVRLEGEIIEVLPRDCRDNQVGLQQVAARYVRLCQLG